MLDCKDNTEMESLSKSYIDKARMVKRGACFVTNKNVKKTVPVRTAEQAAINARNNNSLQVKRERLEDVDKSGQH